MDVDIGDSGSEEDNVDVSSDDNVDIGSDEDAAEEIGSDGDAAEEIGSDEDAAEEIGSDGDAAEEIGSDEEISGKHKLLKSKLAPDVKQSKPGIVYMSTVPPGMNIRQIREYFGQFGEVNRSFLQPDKKGWKGKGKPKNQTFTEGWIEFRKRKHAKRAVVTLNNNPVGGKKRKIYHDFLWNVKYLPGFQWVHLNERLAYERISMKQKLRAEISAVKRETEYFSKSIDLSKQLKKKGVIGNQRVKGQANKGQSADPEKSELREAHVLNVGRPIDLPEKKPPTNSDRASFLKSLFVKGKK